MKKSSMLSLVSFLNSVSDLPSEVAVVRDELNAECAKDAQKSADKRSAYDAAKAIVLAAMGTEPLTVAEIFAKCENDLPEGFSASKIQYGLRVYWADEVRKIENAKGANQYTLA